MPRRLVTLTLLAVVCQAFPATQAVALPPTPGGGATAGRTAIPSSPGAGITAGRTASAPTPGAGATARHTPSAPIPGAGATAGRTAPAPTPGAGATARHTAPNPGGGATAGRIGIQLLDAPTNRREDPRAQVYIVDHLGPGAVIRRHVQVVNQTKQAEHFDLYPAAASIQSGHFIAGDGRARSELTSWITLDRPSLDVPAGGTGKALVTVTVPRNASRGERYAVVWAEVRAKPTARQNVGMANRVGVRVYLDVGPGGEPKSDFDIGTLTAVRGADGTPQLVATVRNTGARALDMTGSLELRDGPGGTSAGPFKVRPGDTPAPGESVRVVVPLRPDLPAGPWSGKLTLRSGLVEHNVSTRFTFPTAGRMQNLSMSSQLPTPLLIVLALGVLLLAAYCGLLLFRRRQSSQ